SGRIFDVSSNGNILLGHTSDSQGPNWVRWDLSGGADPDPARIYTALGGQTVTGMADSGSLMSGTVPSTNSRAIYWTPTDGIKTVTYSEAISYGHGISSNGAV